MNNKTLAIAANSFFRYPYDIAISYVWDYKLNLYSYYIECSYFTYFEVPGTGFQKMIWRKPASTFCINYKNSTIFANNTKGSNVLAFKVAKYLKSFTGYYNESRYIRLRLGDGGLIVNENSPSNSHENPRIKKLFEEYEQWENNKVTKKATQTIKNEEKQQMTESSNIDKSPTTLYDGYKKLSLLLLNKEIEVFINTVSGYKRVIGCKYIENTPSILGKHSQIIEVTTSDCDIYNFNSVDLLKNKFSFSVKPSYTIVDFD